MTRQGGCRFGRGSSPLQSEQGSDTWAAWAGAPVRRGSVAGSRYKAAHRSRHCGQGSPYPARLNCAIGCAGVIPTICTLRTPEENRRVTSALSSWGHLHQTCTGTGTGQLEQQFVFRLLQRSRCCSLYLHLADRLLAFGQLRVELVLFSSLHHLHLHFQHRSLI